RAGIRRGTANDPLATACGSEVPTSNEDTNRPPYCGAEYCRAFWRMLAARGLHVILRMIFSASGGTAMIEISIEADRPVFEVEGWDQLWSLRSRLEIPLAHINGARVDTHPAMGWFQGLRLAGTDLPNLFRAGTYYQDGGLVFWDVRHPEKTIVVDLNHERYQKLVIEVEDPEAAVTRINNAVKAKR